MSCNLRESYDRSCRLCAEEQEVSIMIFSKEAEAMLLQNKINQYLLIEIDENDTLPKNICIRCCTKLHSACEFIETARKAQEILLSRSMLLSQMNTEEKCELTIKSEPIQKIQYFDKGTAVTQMEISIDPMLILQSSDGTDMVQDNDEPSNNCGEEIAYLHGLENENVTIKLIKKNHDIEQAEEETSPKKVDNMECFKPFSCGTCSRSFLTELALKNHHWIHYNDDRSTPFKCSVCSENFHSKSDVMVHMKEHKTSSTCKICGRFFRSEENLHLHLESHKTPAHTFTCKICGRTYNTSSNLKTHSITHSNERPFKCNMCRKSFKRNQDLKFHINQHTGDRPYKCPFCDKSFASSGNCYSHRNRMHPGQPPRRVGRARIKTPSANGTQLNNGQNIAANPPQVSIKGITKFKCQICGHGFMKKENFTYHMFQHTGEKPFQCSFCSEQFVTRRGLTIHHERTHPDHERPLSLLSKNALLS